MLPTQPSLARALAAMLVVACLPQCALGFDATVPSFDVQSEEDIAGRPDASAPDGVSDSDARLDAEVPEGGDTGDGPNDAAVDADATVDADGSSDADAVSARTVTLTAPTAGDYTVGATVEIAWLATGSERVLLSLVNSEVCSAAADGVVVPTIVSVEAAVGRYAWTVPTTLAVGSYRIRAIVESDANDVVACSATFRLVQPPGCDALGCATQNRVCETASGTPTCGGCVEGFDDADSTCVPVDCGTAPAAPSNATLASVSTTRFGGVASYTCDAGHTTTGVAGASTALTRRCGGAGAWEAASGACLPVDCGTNPAAAANARFVGVDRTTFGGTASYRCVAGYVVAGGTDAEYSLMCAADGAWSSGAICEAVDCGTLPAPGNGNVSTVGGTRFGATASYSCRVGYALTGVATRTCQASGSWSGSAPVCSPQVCTPSSTVCADEFNVRECNALGSAQVSRACGTGNYCLGGTCVPQICVPGARSCTDPTTLGTCNAAGSAVTATTCGASDVCIAGACTARICTPNAVTCLDGNTRSICNSDGSAIAAADCASAQYCNAGTCTGQTCTPGVVTCTGAFTRRTCNELGSAWTNSACPASQYCDAGICHPQVCTPDSVVCTSATQVTICNSAGSASVVTSCPAGQTCMAGICSGS